MSQKVTTTSTKTSVKKKTQLRALKVNIVTFLARGGRINRGHFTGPSLHPTAKDIALQVLGNGIGKSKSCFFVHSERRYDLFSYSIFFVTNIGQKNSTTQLEETGIKNRTRVRVYASGPLFHLYSAILPRITPLILTFVPPTFFL